MNIKERRIVCGNEAVAHIAYKTNEMFPIYPITPASEMSELVEEWSTKLQANSFGTYPTVFEMQSEAGVAGAMHGALQTGSLATTFTASQGLLLMLPIMNKISGELTPNVIHVATRSIATHALSIFGDHSDIMAVRSSGYAMIGAANVQEAHDFALISQAATLESRIPFVHFFDGFRTSHEAAKIEMISDETITQIINTDAINEHRSRALNPNSPVLKGSAQGPDMYFQSREAINTYYNLCPKIVQTKMDAFAELTGRQYHLFDYMGHPEAEHIIITMASSSETVEQTIKQLNANGDKFGLIKVRLFRPFSAEHLIGALPTSCRSIAVLDRTKEPGASGEPLYLDVTQSLFEAFQNKIIDTLPTIVGGRYGLASTEFTPRMVHSVFKNLKSIKPQHNFTIGITDDVTHLSLKDSNFELENKSFQALFYNEGTHPNNDALTELTDLIGAEENIYVQSFTERDYNYSTSRHVEHLRIDTEPIKAPYLISNADFVTCQHTNFIEEDNVLQNIKTNGTLLVNSSKTPVEFWKSLSSKTQRLIIEKRISLHIVNIKELNPSYSIRKAKISAFDACRLFLIKGFVDTDPLTELITKIKKVDTSVQDNSNCVLMEEDEDFAKTLLGKLLSRTDNKVLVSDVPADGTFPTDTSQYNPRRNSISKAEWIPEACIQCGACSMACPQGAIRMKVFHDSDLELAPSGFKSLDSEDFNNMHLSIQINTDQCNGCNVCVDACDVGALRLTQDDKGNEENWNYLNSLPEIDRSKLDITKVSEQQLQEPLFKYSNGDEGCGEAPYLKLISQLFGDRLLVANATGLSSIFGGALPTTPWSKNKEGKGPAWSNSLFEDNAEFGLGFRLSLDHQEREAKRLLKTMLNEVDFDLIHDIISANQSNELEIIEQRKRVNELNEILKVKSSKEAQALLKIPDCLVKKSVWCVGGDGWAYDIGFGGLDHVISSGKNVNILILDNEVYANTGGQMSKATPYGATAKFGFGGKSKQKKDLGLMAMTYDDVYVASVAIGANQEQALKAFIEAENFDGPSIIIAYCHNNSHGIDMMSPSRYHKAAVDSGQWILYRNDPRKSSAFQLDSKPPTLKIQDYLKLEQRFEKLFESKDESSTLLTNQLQDQIDKRFNKYNYLAMTSSHKVEHYI